MAFDYEIKYEENSSITHADTMSRLKLDQDDDECNLVDCRSHNLVEFCVHFAKHKLTHSIRKVEQGMWTRWFAGTNY